MPNFRGKLFGLVTRISPRPNSSALYRAYAGGRYVEAVPLRYDTAAFLRWFDANWPEGSPAALSYRERITRGPDSEPSGALIEGFACVVVRQSGKAEFSKFLLPFCKFLVRSDRIGAQSLRFLNGRFRLLSGCRPGGIRQRERRVEDPHPGDTQSG